MNIPVLGLCAGLLVVTGCVRTIDGKHTAGMPFVKDIKESRYQRPLDQVWVAAKDVLAFNGTIHVEDIQGKVLEAKVDTRTVWLRLEPLDQNLTQVILQVRTKGGASDMILAGELDKQIAVRLATGRLSPATSPK